MLKQLMSALGVQGATIDTRIFDSNTQGGAWLGGEIRVEAGEGDHAGELRIRARFDHRRGA